MRVDICLPVYNEEQVLETNSKRLLNFCRTQHFPFEWNIIIVINGSSDQSSAIANRLAEQFSEIKVLNISAPGRGQALSQAWQSSNADICAYMDSDLVVDLECLPLLLEPIIKGETDIAFGSRFKQGATVERSWLREIVSRSYNSLAQLFVGHTARDLQCGFKAINRSVFLKLAPYTTDHHWFFDTELIIWAERLGFRVTEVPVSWQESRFGKRKSTVKLLKDSLYFISSLTRLRKSLKK